MVTIYVNQSASGDNDGSSWGNAYTDLQSALAIAAPNDEIWVAEGTYKPTTDTSRGVSFDIPSAVGIYGGFAGGETSREQRDWFNNVTILSGDIGQEGIITDNSLSVVDITSTTPTTILDGFTISDGKNDGNSGGGIVAGGNASATLRNLVIRDNTAASGGGLFTFGGDITLIDVSFIDNSTEGRGGAIYTTTNGIVTVENGLFVGNEAQIGGAIYGIADVDNSTFYNNQAADGGALSLFGNLIDNTDANTVENSIFWNNAGSENNNQISGNTAAIVNNSIVEGGYEGPGTNIINADPLFFDPENNDLRLQRTSPGVDAGNNDVVTVDTDLVDNPRIFNNTVDIGAYEYGVFMSINDVTIEEGDEGTTNAEFTVTLEDTLGEPATEEVTVNYTTSSDRDADTAVVGEDYTTTEGTLTFNVGDTTQTITVPIVADERIEGDNSFSVELSGVAGNAEIIDSRGVGIIENDDQRREITISDATVDEGDEEETAIEFTVSLDRSYVEEITVDYNLVENTAIPGEDYTDIDGRLAFQPGETEASISVSVLSDEDLEGDESFFLQLSEPSNAATIEDGRATGTIVNDDSEPEPSPEPTPEPTPEPEPEPTPEPEPEPSPEPEPEPTPEPSPEPEPEPTPEEDPLEALDTEINRFQNTAVPGTYLFAGEEESENIRENFDNFEEEGLAFQVAVEPEDDLIPLYRFQSTTTPGTYLFAGEEERQSINENFSESFNEEGLAFYVYGADSNVGTTFYRFQNTARPGTYLFAGPEERQNILDNFPEFVEEGAAFNVEG
jgi:predicted outer membrane repeat protein